MFSVFRNATVSAATLALAAGFALTAQAAYTVTLVQQGPDVVASGSGSIDLTDLSFEHNLNNSAFIIPNDALIYTGPSFPVVSPLDRYTGLTGPTSFGRGGGDFPVSGSGDLVGIEFGANAFQALFVPAGYLSGAPLTDTSTYAGQTFASLGVTPGTYVWTWGTGADADTFTLQIGAAAAPEPASLTVLAMGLAGLGMVLRTRRA